MRDYQQYLSTLSIIRILDHIMLRNIIEEVFKRSNMNSQQSPAIFAVWVSLMSNISLTFLKIVVGFVFKSQVLIADGVHNAGDVLASVAALTSTKLSKKPADKDHPFGHGKAEDIATGIVAFILVIATFIIVLKSVESFIHPVVETSLIALIAGVVSLIWKQGLYMYCLRIGKIQKSKSLIATAYDHLADVYASIAVCFGIGIALLGNIYDIPFSEYGDSVAGIVVSYFVLKLALKMGNEAIGVLMDKNISTSQLEQIITIVRKIPQVRRVDGIRAREHGHYIIVDLIVSVSKYTTVLEGDEIGRQIIQYIKLSIANVEEVFVYFKPWHGVKDE